MSESFCTVCGGFGLHGRCEGIAKFCGYCGRLNHIHGCQKETTAEFRKRIAPLIAERDGFSAALAEPQASDVAATSATEVKG